MKKLFLSAALLAAFPAAFAQTAISVNGEIISPADQKEIMSAVKAQGVKDEAKQLEAARNVLIENKILEQAARKAKLTDTPQSQLALLSFLTQFYSNELAKKYAAEHPASEAQIKEMYEALKNEYNPNEIKIRHILVKTEAEAKELIKKIQAGGNMAELAKTESIDKVTGPAGGEVGFTNIRQIAVPGLAETAMTLNKGQLLSTPFKTAAGFQVIKLEDKREVPYPELSKIKPQVEQLAAQKQIREYMASLFKDTKVDLDAKTENKSEKATDSKKRKGK